MSNCAQCRVELVGSPVDRETILRWHVVRSFSSSLCLKCFSASDDYVTTILNGARTVVDVPRVRISDDAVRASLGPGYWLDRTLRHFKRGDTYTVVDFTEMHDTREPHLTYVSHAKSTRSTSPVQRFLDEVVWRGEIVPRFECLEIK